MTREEVASAVRGRDAFLARIAKGSAIYGIQLLTKPARWIQSWHQWYSPPQYAPDLVKCYRSRPALPIRVFSSAAISQTPESSLPTLFVIHGGGFCLGEPQDDDVWNYKFSRMHDILVIELNYRKAPWWPYPTAVHDLEALIVSVLEDQSLPIDKSRTAVAGFSAGGNLALSLVQRESVRELIKPAAVASMYGLLDFTVSADIKAQTRYYKADLSPKRNTSNDFLFSMAPIFDWSYLPIGQELRDPLVSPIYASADRLPPHVFICSAELDMLAHEGWRMAHRLAGKPEPSLDVPVGRREPAIDVGRLEHEDERFWWEWKSNEGRSVKWLLVPDVMHGFDYHLRPAMLGDTSSVDDAHLKAEAYMKIFGHWLLETAWK